MSYRVEKRQFAWTHWCWIGLFAVMFLPMAPSFAQSTPDNQAPQEPSAQATTPYPVVVATTPKTGATDVDPNLDAIAVTFDRPMAQGMSWTGGGPEFPPLDPAQKPHWKDDRTCLLPVSLAKGKFYRVGINAKSHQNFRSADGVAAPPAVIRFTTKGATSALKRRARVPQVLRLKPANGDTKVDPNLQELRVTFDMPMGEGMSWTGGGPTFPKIPEGERPSWTRDGKTCVLPVQLKPDTAYRLGINSLSHNNFQSKWGVPVEPIVYEFQTQSAR